MRVLFDTQQWNYFASTEDAPHPTGALATVRRAAAAGQLEVVGSLNVLQEVIEAARTVPQKAESMVDLFFDLTKHRLLLPLNERHHAEAAAGGLLEPGARYISRQTRRKVSRLARSRRDVLDLANVLNTAKTEFRVSELETQEMIRGHLRELGGPPTQALMREWMREVDIDAWVADLLEEGDSLGHHQIVIGGAGPDRYPSAWTFIAVRLARLVAALGEGRRIEPSDLADAHIASSGPYVDVLVTDDREFRRSFDILNRPMNFACESSTTFFARAELCRFDDTGPAGY